MTIETFPYGDIDEFSNRNATKKTLLAMKTIKNICLELFFDLILKTNVNAKRVWEEVYEFRFSHTYQQFYMSVTEKSLLAMK
jgi:hypothetical protein